MYVCFTILIEAWCCCFSSDFVSVGILKRGRRRTDGVGKTNCLVIFFKERRKGKTGGKRRVLGVCWGLCLSFLSDKGQVST